jgi:hypothetical protein
MEHFTSNAKILLAMMTILLAVLFTTKSYSQNKSDPTIVKVEAVCISEKDLESVIDGEFKELPMLTMVSTREINGKEIAIPAVMFVNPKTQTWTIVEKWADNRYCIVGVGANVAPYQESAPGTKL